MTDLFPTYLFTEGYDHKPFEQIKLQILTCCVEQQRHRHFFEVQRFAAPKRHKKYKRTMKSINQVDTR